MDWQFKVGLGVAVVFGLLPFVVKDMPHWVTWPGLMAAGLFILWGLFPRHDSFPIFPTLLFIGFSAAVAASAAWGYDLFSANVDKDYVIYSVDIRDPQNLTAQLPVIIASPSPSSFDNVDQWWAPWGSQDTDPVNNPTSSYWSIGHQMKVVFPFVRGAAGYGRSISASDYLIQSNTTFKGINYHFEERLNIHQRNGLLIQEIQIWRSIGNDKLTLVYSGNG